MAMAVGWSFHCGIMHRVEYYIVFLLSRLCANVCMQAQLTDLTVMLLKERRELFTLHLNKVIRMNRRQA